MTTASLARSQLTSVPDNAIYHVRPTENTHPHRPITASSTGITNDHDHIPFEHHSSTAPEHRDTPTCMYIQPRSRGQTDGFRCSQCTQDDSTCLPLQPGLCIGRAALLAPHTIPAALRPRQHHVSTNWRSSQNTTSCTHFQPDHSCSTLPQACIAGSAASITGQAQVNGRCCPALPGTLRSGILWRRCKAVQDTTKRNGNVCGRLILEQRQQLDRSRQHMQTCLRDSH